jgi:hypothetical protein
MRKIIVENISHNAISKGSKLLNAIYDSNYFKIGEGITIVIVDSKNFFHVSAF